MVKMKGGYGMGLLWWSVGYVALNVVTKFAGIW